MKFLKYTPTSNENLIELKGDVKEFTRKVKLIEMFAFELQEIEIR